jgi:hypothetical protein
MTEKTNDEIQSPVNNSYTEAIHVLKGLERKAEITRNANALVARRIKTKIDLILGGSIFFSILIAFVALVGPNFIPQTESYQLLFNASIATLGFALLIFSISDRILGLNEKFANHTQAIKFLTDFIRECNQFRHLEMDKLSDNELIEKITRFQNDYSRLNQLLPLNDLTDIEFLYVKQDFYKKVHLSKLLDKNPCVDIDAYWKDCEKLKEDTKDL